MLRIKKIFMCSRLMINSLKLRNYSSFESSDPFAFMIETEPQKEIKEKLNIENSESVANIFTKLTSSSNKMNQFNVEEVLKNLSDKFSKLTSKEKAKMENKQYIEKLFYKFKEEINQPTKNQSIALANLILEANKINLCNNKEIISKASKELTNLDLSQFSIDEQISKLHDIHLLSDITNFKQFYDPIKKLAIENDISINSLKLILNLYQRYHEKFENTDIINKNIFLHLEEISKESDILFLMNLYKFIIEATKTKNNKENIKFQPEILEIVKKRILRTIYKANEHNIILFMDVFTKRILDKENIFASKLIQKLNSRKFKDLNVSSYRMQAKSLDFIANNQKALTITSDTISVIIDNIAKKLFELENISYLDEILKICENLKKLSINSPKIFRILKDLISKEKMKDISIIDLSNLGICLMRIGLFNFENQSFFKSKILDLISSDNLKKVNISYKIKLLLVSSEISKNLKNKDEKMIIAIKKLEELLSEDEIKMNIEYIISLYCNITNQLFKQSSSIQILYESNSKEYEYVESEDLQLSFPDISLIINRIISLQDKLKKNWPKLKNDERQKIFYALVKNQFLFENFGEFVSEIISKSLENEILNISRSSFASESKYGSIILIREMIKRNISFNFSNAILNLLKNYEIREDYFADELMIQELKKINPILANDTSLNILKEWFKIGNKSLEMGILNFPKRMIKFILQSFSATNKILNFEDFKLIFEIQEKFHFYSEEEQSELKKIIFISLQNSISYYENIIEDEYKNLILSIIMLTCQKSLEIEEIDDIYLSYLLEKVIYNFKKIENISIVKGHQEYFLILGFYISYSYISVSDDFQKKIITTIMRKYDVNQKYRIICNDIICKYDELSQISKYFQFNFKKIEKKYIRMGSRKKGICY